MKSKTIKKIALTLLTISGIMGCNQNNDTHTDRSYFVL